MTRILHDHGIDPAPERSRRMLWKTFLQAPWEGLTACDLFTVEVLTLAGLQRYLVFFVTALQSRRVTIAGIHPQPYGTWMEQMARNVTDPVDGCVRRARYLMHDRDPAMFSFQPRVSNRISSALGGLRRMTRFLSRPLSSLRIRACDVLPTTGAARSVCVCLCMTLSVGSSHQFRRRCAMRSRI